MGRCYGLAIELQVVPSKTAKKFNILNCRSAKFGMGGLLYRGNYISISDNYFLAVFGSFPRVRQCYYF